MIPSISTTSKINPIIVFFNPLKKIFNIDASSIANGDTSISVKYAHGAAMHHLIENSFILNCLNPTDNMLLPTRFISENDFLIHSAQMIIFRRN